jgi:hypothetical protein
MYRQNVRSSNIRSIGYENGILEVEFNESRVYQYSGVPENLYKELMSANSQGKFLNEYIKGSYHYKQVS